MSFPDPHHPFNPPGKYWDMYKPEQFPVPEAFRRNDWTPPPHVQEAIEERASGKANLHGMRSIATTAREAQEAQALTCGMIACIDDGIGRVLRALDASGQRDNTVIIFTTDHGDHLGDHRLLLKGCEQYQSILHVPFIWSDPQAPAAAATDAIGSTIDIPATILDRARIQPYVGMQGKSLLPSMGADGKAGARLRLRAIRAPDGGQGCRPHAALAHDRGSALSHDGDVRLRTWVNYTISQPIPASSTICGTSPNMRASRRG